MNNYFTTLWKALTGNCDCAPAPTTPPMTVREALTITRAVLAPPQPTHLNAKLSAGTVRTMRAAYKKGGVTYQELADHHGVHCSTAYCAITRRTYKGVK